MSANDYGWLMITALYFPPKRNREHDPKQDKFTESTKP